MCSETSLGFNMPQGSCPAVVAFDITTLLHHSIVAFDITTLLHHNIIASQHCCSRHHNTVAFDITTLLHHTGTVRSNHHNALAAITITVEAAQQCFQGSTVDATQQLLG